MGDSKKKKIDPIPEAGQAVMLEIAKHEKDPGVRPYYPASVGTSCTVGYMVEREFTILNDTEYVRLYNQRHKAKDPKLAEMTLMAQDGSSEKVYLFKSAEEPHRKLKIFSMVQEAKEEELMAPSGHVFARQAQEWLETATAKRLHDTNLSAALSPQAWSNLSTTAEYEVTAHETRRVQGWGRGGRGMRQCRAVSRMLTTPFLLFSGSRGRSVHFCCQHFFL